MTEKVCNTNTDQLFKWGRRTAEHFLHC